MKTTTTTMTMTRAHHWFAVLCIGVVAVGCNSQSTSSRSQSTTPSQTSVEAGGTTTIDDIEYWKLAIALPTGVPLHVGVTLIRGADGGFTGTADIPMQRVKDIPVTAIARQSDQIGFTLPPGAVIDAIVDADGETASGTLKQRGQTMSVSLERVTSRAELPQPSERQQTPRPPFPYNQRDVAYQNLTDNSTLGGTLTVPSSPGPHPAALLITGSGLQDRDETIFEHKPFLVIADYLTRRGFAVLRVDDRGIGASTGDATKATVETHATDVEAGLAFLARQPEIDPKRIGLIGHSEGGLIAPLVASRRPSVAFVITLAGPGVSGSELIPLQIGEIMRKQGIANDVIESLLGAQRAILSALAARGDRSTVARLVREGIALTRRLAPDQQSEALTAEQLDAMVESEMRAFDMPWFYSFITLEPGPLWQKVSCPVLALNGENDVQVPADINLRKIEEHARKGGNRDVSAKKYPRLNHLFQRSRTGLIDEYAVIEHTIDESVLEQIASWLRERMMPAK